MTKLGYSYGDLMAVRSLSWLAEDKSVHGINFSYSGEKNLSKDLFGYFYSDESDRSVAIIINTSTEETFFAFENINSDIEKKIMDWVIKNMELSD